MRKIKIAGNARDRGPLNALEAFLKTLSPWYALSVSDNTVESNVRSAAITQADVVLIGLSSTAEYAAIEIEAAHMAAKTGRPYGFIAISPVDVIRPWLKDAGVTDGCTFVCGVLPSDHARMRAFYPNAQFFHTSTPDRDLFALMGGQKTELRHEARVRLGVQDDEVLIGIALRKEFGNIPTIAGVQELVRTQFPRDNARIVLLKHPGDPLRDLSSAKYGPQDPYEYFLRYSGVTHVEVDHLKSVEVVPGLDCIVGIETDSTCVMAAHLRIPVIVMRCHEAVAHFQAMTGGAPLEMIENGTAVEVPVFGSSCDLMGDFMPQKENMERFYPPSMEKNPSAHAMADMFRTLGIG
jgi:hypothetical protein